MGDIKVSGEVRYYSELKTAMAERGNRLREKVKESLLYGVSDYQLLEIMERINNSWRDTLRPALTSFSCEAVGGQPKEADDAGLMFTLASLGFGVHDDIIDQSTHKKFKPTILGRYGLEGALLAGDLLIVKGWTALQGMLLKNYPPEKIALVIQTYGKLNLEICEAELADAYSKHKLVTVEQHQQFLWKAMAEIEACTRIGAILGNGKNEEIHALAQYGRYLGINFRMFDQVRDCLNLEANLAHRIKHESVPLPLLFAAYSSPKRFTKIESIVKKRNISTNDLRILLEACFDSDAFNSICSLAKKNRDKASLCLDNLKSTYARDILSLLLKRSCDDIYSLLK